MKFVFFVVLFKFYGIFCYCQEGQPGCSNFKTGKFAYKDSTGNVIEVIRKGAKQQEYDRKKDVTIKFKIRWTGDCEYQLKQVWSNSKTVRKQNFSVYNIVITKVNGNESYEYDCACRNTEFKGPIGTMVRMRE